MVHTHIAWDATLNDLQAIQRNVFATWHYGTLQAYKRYFLEQGFSNIFWPSKYAGRLCFDSDSMSYSTYTYPNMQTFEQAVLNIQNIEELVVCLHRVFPQDFLKLDKGILIPCTTSPEAILQSLERIIKKDWSEPIMYPSFRVASVLIYVYQIEMTGGDTIHELSGSTMYRYMTHESYAKNIDQIWQVLFPIRKDLPQDLAIHIYPVKFIQPFIDGSCGFEKEIIYLKERRREIIREHGWIDETFRLKECIEHLMHSKSTLCDIEHVSFSALRDRYIRLRNSKNSRTYGS